MTKLKLKSAGCTVCMGCQKRAKFECVIRDEVSTLVKRIPGFDAVVFATPVYFFGPNAQIKVVLDRMFSHTKIDMKTGKYTHVKGYPVIGLLATAGGDLNEGLNICKMIFKTLAEFTSKKFETLLVPLAPADPAELLKRDDIKKKAFHMGRKLAGK
ncbi:MAG: NADPH-dependent FMN reductase [Planctomycetes bacterium ADurb.Bin412]|nr:MAG: NADPH-dependent FMN reductase [Planctomycetes bacterium ADurb.Bin412]